MISWLYFDTHGPLAVRVFLCKKKSVKVKNTTHRRFGLEFNGTTYMSLINSRNIDLYTPGIIEFATINNDKSLFYDMEKAKGKIDLMEAEKKIAKLREKQGIFVEATAKELALIRELAETKASIASVVALEVAKALAKEKNDADRVRALNPGGNHSQPA